MPKPIPGTVPSGLPTPFPQDIHWSLHGPSTATTAINGLPGFGLDVDPATITDYEGFTAHAVIIGTATMGDGTPAEVEFDVRAFEGRYVGEDGKTYEGAFGFF